MHPNSRKQRAVEPHQPSRARTRTRTSAALAVALGAWLGAGCGPRADEAAEGSARAPAASGAVASAHVAGQAPEGNAGAQPPVIARDPVTPTPAPVAMPAEGAALDLTPTSETLARAARTVRAPSVDAQDGDAVTRQLGVYGELSRLGAPVVVRFPLVQASVGWGCQCPGTFVGVDPDSYSGGETWLDVRLEPGLALPESGRAGRVSLVEGIFTGQTVELDLRDDGDPPEWLYHPRVVRVLRIVRAHAEAAPELPVRAVRLYEAPERIACRTYTADPDPPTRVRASASNRAAIVGELPRDTELGLVAVERGWLRIRAPLEGYVHGSVTRASCAGDPR